MNVSTRISLGAAGFMVLLGAVLLHHAAQVEHLAEAQESLAAIRFQAAYLALEARRQIDLLEEHLWKYNVTGDAAYGLLARRVSGSCGGTLSSLQALDLAPTERQASRRLAASWAEFTRRFLPGDPPPARQPGKPPDLMALLLRRLREETQAVTVASQEVLTAQAAAARRLSRRAARFSWGVAGGALLLSLLACTLAVRAINRPLRRLGEATRAVGEGRLSFRLAASGRDEFSRLAGAFNTMIARLEELDRAKKTFFSRVSHDLKTPLVALQETTRVLATEIPGPLTPEQRLFLEAQTESGRRLAGMIDDLLVLARLETGTLTYAFAPCDLVELVRAATAEFAARAGGMGLRLVAELPAGPLVVRGDRDRLAQVLENLLENAVKFSPAGGEVRIGLQAAAPPAGGGPDPGRGGAALRGPGSSFVRLSVADCGPGIPAAEQQRVFDDFYQGRGNHRAGTGGMGLGLAICREIVGAHQGAIRVENGPMGGAAIHVLLPLAVRHDEDERAGLTSGEGRLALSRGR